MNIKEREDWLAKPHALINYSETFAHEYNITAMVPISEEAKQACRKFDLDVYINKAATEPRWEAWGKSIHERAFGQDPNQVILECATICRKRTEIAPDEKERK